jgi:hypothetical protein
MLTVIPLVTYDKGASGTVVGTLGIVMAFGLENQSIDLLSSYLIS